MTESAPIEPSPRAFCQTTGLVFQVVGFALAMGSCCWWSFGDSLTGGPELIQVQEGRSVNVLDRTPVAAKTWGMIAVCASFAGGLGLTALGLALQHDLARTGRPASWVTGLLAAYFWSYIVVAVTTFPSIARLLVGGAMAMIWTAMFLLAGASGQTLRKSPPPKRDSKWTSRDEDDLRRTSSLPPRDGMSR